MASLQDDDRGGVYRIEPNNGRATRHAVESPARNEPDADPEEDVARRLYYIRGKSGTERVVATIRARSRSRAIRIAADNGILVDREELRND